MSDVRTADPERRAYVKPELKQVLLAADEVFVYGCKRTGRTGRNYGACRNTNRTSGFGQCTQRTNVS